MMSDFLHVGTIAREKWVEDVCENSSSSSYPAKSLRSRPSRQAVFHRLILFRVRYTTRVLKFRGCLSSYWYFGGNAEILVNLSYCSQEVCLHPQIEECKYLGIMSTTIAF